MPTLPTGIIPGQIGHLNHHDQIHAQINRALDAGGDVAVDFQVADIAARDAITGQGAGSYCWVESIDRIYRWNSTAWVALSDLGYEHPVDYGALGDASTDNTTAIQDAVAALPASGGVVWFGDNPSGVNFHHSGTIDCHDKIAITFSGPGAQTSGAIGGALLLYTGTGARGWDFRSTSGVGFRHISVGYSAAGFAGVLIDYAHSAAATDSAYGLIDDCTVFGVNAAGQTAVLVGWDKAIFCKVRDTTVLAGGVGVRGVAAVGSYSNGNVLDAVAFSNQAVVPIKNPGQDFTVIAPHIEPRRDGTAGFLACDAGIPSIGFTVIGGWMGDANTGTWVDFKGSGYKHLGGYVSLGTAITYMKAYSGDRGIEISPGQLAGSGGAACVILDLSAAAANSVYNVNLLGLDIPDPTFTIFSDLTKLASALYQDANGNFVSVGNHGFVSVGPDIRTITANFVAASLGTGFRAAEGANAKQGSVALGAGGVVVVANTSVTANSRIFLTSQADAGAPGFLRVSARVAGVSFTITSSSPTDTSTVAYEIFEPA